MIPWENAAILLQADVLIALLNIALLGGIGGFLVFLHVRIRTLKQDLQALPQLSALLNKNMVKAQEELKGLKSALKEIEPTAGTLIKDGQTVSQDLDFFIHRAQKTLQKLEKLEMQTKASQKESLAASSPQPDALEIEMQKGVAKPAPSSKSPFEARLAQDTDVTVSLPASDALPEGVGVSPAEEKLRARLGLADLAKLGARRG